MKPNKRRQLGRGAMELIEEAVHLLRLNGASSLAAYYLGTLPFVLALLFFWADMSRSPFAAKALPGSALGLALLFLWMKFWQTVFLNGLRARISAQPLVRWNFRRCLRVFVVQTAIQPSALVMLPLALLPAAVPSGWVYAFYQNVTALTDGESGEIGKVFRRAWKQSFLWPMQNHSLLLILLGFGFFVFLNLATVCFLLPQLLKMLLGIESVYTQSPTSLFNTTFVTALFALTYLCLDPIVKTVYLLRCFYGESLQSGEDLKAELKRFAPFAAQVAAVAFALFFFSCSCNAADASPSDTRTTAPVGLKASPDAIPPQTLDKTINEILHQTKYAWRMPREKVVEETTDGPIARFFRSVLTWIKDTVQSALDWLDKMLNKLFRKKPVAGKLPTGFNWANIPQTLLFLLLALVLCALALVLFRVWQKSYRRPEAISSEAIAPLPDLADENVGADQLPEDGWIKLGRELLSKGELRLALRAFYFASLSHLASRSLISIAKFKSNRDYERELTRRGHALPDLLALFGENVLVFDETWYGLHEVNQETVARFLTNVERIKNAG